MKERVQFVAFTLYEFGHNILRKLQKKACLIYIKILESEVVSLILGIYYSKVFLFKPWKLITQQYVWQLIACSVLCEKYINVTLEISRTILQIIKHLPNHGVYTFSIVRSLSGASICGINMAEYARENPTTTWKDPAEIAAKIWN